MLQWTNDVWAGQWGTMPPTGYCRQHSFSILQGLWTGSIFSSAPCLHIYLQPSVRIPLQGGGTEQGKVSIPLKGTPPAPGQPQQSQFQREWGSPRLALPWTCTKLVACTRPTRFSAQHT